LKKKILIISSEFPPLPGGIGNHAYNVGLTLQKRGFEITILVFDREKYNNVLFQFDKSQSFKIIRVEKSRNIFKMYFQRITYSRKQVKENNFIILTGKASLWMHLFFSKKATGVVHGSELLLKNSLLNYLTNKALRKTKNIIAVSNFTRNLLNKELQSKCVVINNGVNLDEFDLKPKTKPETIDFISVGSIHQRKGQHNFIAALPEIINRFKNSHYHIIGINDNSEYLKINIEEYQLYNYVTIYGRIDRDILIRKLKECSIVIMLSENTNSGDVEGFGISLIESNAMGLPSIGSKGTGIEDAIRNNFNGILVNPKNVNEIVKAIETILDDYENFSKNAIVFAKQCSWDILINDYITQITN